MPRNTHKIRHTLLGLALAAAVAAFAAPAATAGGGSSDTYKDGWYGYAVALTKQQQPQGPNTLLDGRSPDTRDAATIASLSRLTPTDGRSPDTVDSAVQAHLPIVTVVRSPGFVWGDFGIGVAAAFGLMLFVAGFKLLASRRQAPIATA
jgi:hypothetical protein